jgi:acetyl esterase/lipase
MSAPGNSRRLVAPELLSVLDRFPEVELNDETLASMRAAAKAMPPPPLSPLELAVRCEEQFTPGPPGAPEVRVLIYTPPTKSSSLRPAYLQLHGGGFVMGAPEMNDGANRVLAAGLDCIIVSVDYRLAPETRFPGAVEDAYAALLWLHREAKPLGVDGARIAIGGQSAGAGHAAALALRARDRGEIPICLQMLDSPMIDDRTGSTADPHPYCGEFAWTPAKNRFCWRALLGEEPGGPEVPVEAVPARVSDLSKLPPAFILVGALDLFLEENIEYARRLIRAGVPTELHIIPGAFHGFTSVGGEAPQTKVALTLRRAALARAFACGLAS